VNGQELGTARKSNPCQDCSWPQLSTTQLSYPYPSGRDKRLSGSSEDSSGREMQMSMLQVGTLWQTGKLSADPRSWVGLGSPTLTVQDMPSDFDGYGFSGQTLSELGRAPSYPAMNLIERSSGPPPRFLLAIEKRPPSGTTIGETMAPFTFWPRTCTRLPLERSTQWPRR
jgi:hypothetical protein